MAANIIDHVLFTHPFPLHQEYEVEDDYEIPDRRIDPAKLAPPLDHDLYTQNEMKKKFGKRYRTQSERGRGEFNPTYESEVLTKRMRVLNCRPLQQIHASRRMSPYDRR